MTNTSHSKNSSLDDLTEEVNANEQALGTLKELGHTANETISVYEDGPAPEDPVEILPDPGGDIPDDRILVCRGTVWIVNQKQKVIAVRVRFS